MTVANQSGCFKKMGLHRGLGMTLLFSTCMAAAWGQVGSRASMYGTVRDSSGAVVPGVRVQAKNLGTNHAWTTASNAQGEFSLPNLPIGRYSVTARHAGFSTYLVRGYVLRVARSALINIVLHPGAVSQTITVHTRAPMVDTKVASLKTTIPHRFVEQLPLMDRSLGTLQFLVPGATSGTIGGLSLNGSRGGHSNYRSERPVRQ